MGREKFELQPNKGKPPVQQELFFGKKEDKKRDALLEKMRAYQDTFRDKLRNRKKEEREKKSALGSIDPIEIKKNKDGHVILWGPAHYQLPGKYHSIGASERVEVYFGDDGRWRVKNKIVPEADALKLIKDDEEGDEYDKIVEEIRRLKKDLKLK